MAESPQENTETGGSKYFMRKRRRTSPAPDPNASIMESAMELFSKRPTTSSDSLPSSKDPQAIDAFFRRRRTCFKDLIPKCPNVYNSLPKGEIPDDHPMKSFVDQNDQGMSVKEALARGFQNYRVRLPKQRRVIMENSVVPPGDHRAAQNLSAILANQLASTETSPSPPAMSIEELFSTLVKNEIVDDQLDEPVDDEGMSGPQSSIAQLLEIQGSQSLEVSGIEDYPLPPFWKLPIEVFRGYKGGFFVKGVKYVQMSTLICQSSIMVPVTEPMRFSINGSIYEYSLAQLFAANGIFIRKPTEMSELSNVFSTSGLAVHHSISEYLLNTFGPLTTLGTKMQINRDHPPIHLGAECPPFACFRVSLFVGFLGTHQGPNEIMDENFGLTAPLTSPDYLKREREIPLSDQLLIVVSSDKGCPPASLAAQFGTTEEEIESILARREEILGSSAKALMEMPGNEREEQEASPMLYRRKSRYRRTTYGGVNVLVWKYFKNCAAQGVAINGKDLKDQAMQIAQQIGVKNFKGSEGWLDSFKKRHKIDLRTMTGCPAAYEDNDYQNASQNDVDESDETDVDIKPIINSDEGEGQATAVASIGNTQPLDLGHIFGFNTEKAKETPPSSRTSTLDERGFIAKIVKSTAIHIPDKEVSSAIDTLRTYILSKNIEALPILLDLQERLSQTAQTSSENDGENREQ